MRITLVFIILGSLPLMVSAQLSVYGGAGYSIVRSQHLVGDVQPQTGYQAGIRVQMLPRQPVLLHPGILLGIERNGYVQVIDNIRHQYRLTYITLTPFVGYDPAPRWNLSVGTDLSGLLRARYREANQNIGVIENYRSPDIRLRGDVQWQLFKQVHAYLSYTHGLRNLIKYPAIDEAGNFVGTIQDGRSSIISVGVRIDTVLGL